MSDYYTKKKEESDKKIQEALEARKKRKETEENSLASKKEESDSKIGAALEERSKRVQGSLPSVMSEIENLMTVEIDHYNSATPSYGTYDTTYENQRERRIGISNLRNKVSVYRNYMDDGVADYILNTLDQMERGYDAYLYMSQFESEDDYNNAVEQAKAYEELLNFDLEAGLIEIDDLETILEEFIQLERFEQDDAGNKRLDELRKKYGSTKELKGLITEKKAYLKRANRSQETTRMSSVNDPNAENYDPEFTKYSGYKSTMRGQFLGRPVMVDEDYETVNHRQSDYNVSLRNADAATTGDTDEQEWINTLLRMSDEEVSIYNYYYAKYGKDEAAKYLDSIVETINHREAEEMFNSLDGNIALELAFGFAAGLDQFETGVKNFLSIGDDYIPLTATQIASGMVRDDLNDKSIPLWYNANTGKWEDKILGNSLGQVAYDSINTTGNMFPSIIASAVVGMMNPTAGQIVGSGMMGISSAGNAYQEMLNLGYDKGQARLYSTMVGASEAGLQYLLGGISKMGGKLSGSAISKILDGVDNAFARIAIQLGGNMLSEGLEEGLQEVITPWFKQIALHIDEDVNWNEVAYSSLLGALSSVVMEGGSTIGGEVSRQVQHNKTGKAVMASDGGVDTLMNLAYDVAGASSKGTKKSIMKQANMVGKKATANRVGALYDTVTSASTSANQSDIAKSLKRNGFTSRKANAIAEALVARNNGQELIRSQSKLLESVKDNQDVQDAISGIIDNSKSTMGQRTQNLRSLQKDVAIQRLANTKSRKTEAEYDEYDGYEASDDYIDEGEFEQFRFEVVREATRKAVDESKNRGDISEEYYSQIIEILDNADADGDISKYDAYAYEFDAQTYSRSALEEMYRSQKAASEQSMDTQDGYSENDDESKVSAAVASLEGIIDEATAKELTRHLLKLGNTEASTYGQAIVHAYKHGYYFNRESMAGDDLVATLTEEQKNVAYGLGERYRNSKTSADQAKARSATVSKKQNTSASDTAPDGTKYKKVRFEGEINKWDEKQQSEVAFIDFIASNFSGNTVHVFESYLTEDGKYVYMDSNGNIHAAPNGMYISSTGDIYIDLNAGNRGEGLVMNTFAHELYHHIQRRSPEKARKLAEFLVQELGYKNVEEAIQRQIDKADRAGYGVDYFMKSGMSRSAAETEVYDRAFNDFVADSLETMFTEGDAVGKLQKLKSQDEGLFNMIKDFIDKWVNKLRQFYRNHSTISVEGGMVRQLEKFEQIQQMFVEALVDAGENYQAALENVAEENAEAVSSDEIITDGAVVTDGVGTKFSIKSMKHDIAEGKMFEDLKTYCGWTQQQVNELRQNLENLVEYMTPHRNILDMNESYGREGRRFSPYKPNSDPLYKISMDFSTLCSKRLLTQYVIENLQLRENRPMSAEEQMAIRDMLNEYRKVEKGLQVACAMCYVEAARLKSPKQIQRWLNDPAPSLRDYFGKKNKEFNDSVKEAQADFKESRGYARNAPKKDMKNADRKELDKIGPKLRSKYQLSAEEQGIVEKAKTLPNITYLTAGNLSDLSETDPVIYDAYTAFVRSATISKSLETDEPYYYGDSRRDNGNGIVVSDSFIEAVNRENGMRFSSWSDWRIQHLLDYITAVIDNSVRGAAMHGYTKFGEEVRVLGKTGMMFNMSGVAGTQTGLNEDGSLNFSPTESIDVNEAIQLREEFPETAGLQCIGVSDAHIIALLRSDIIDYVIPYHVSGLNAALRRMADIYGWDDYTGTQHATIDKSIKKENAADHEHWHEEPIFSEFFVGYGTDMSGIEAMRASAERYKQMCKDRGLTPKFNQFANEDNYWKLLIDRKMINQKTGNLIRQKAVTPTFDFNTIKAVVDRYVDNYDSGLEARALNYIVENWDSIPKRIKDLKKQGGTKAKKTKKAIGTLANQTLAAQPATKMSDRDYSYEALISKPDMVVTTVDGNHPKNRADVVAQAKKNATSVGRFDTKTGSVSIRVKDIDADVILGRDGLKHSLDRRFDVNAPVVIKAGEILSNSIRINELTPQKAEAAESYVLIGVARNDSGELYIVRSVVNRFNSELTSMDVLYAINAKKEPAALLPLSTGEPALGTDSTISIASLLDYVNEYFPDILPEDVLKHYGYDARPEGGLGEDALFSNRDTDSVSNRSLLANAFEGVAQNDAEKKKIREYRGKIELIEAEERKLGELNEKIRELSFARGPRDAKAIRDLQFEAQQTANRINTYDKQLLRLEASKPLQDVLAREKKMAYKKAEQRGKEALAAYRERTAKTQRELLERMRESREQGIESRRKTAMRQKIRKVIRDLDKILNHGDKKRNVKEGMKDFVAEALASAEVLFTDNYTNEDIVRNGFSVELSEEEAKYVEEARAILEKMSDLPTGGYEAWQERQEAEKKFKRILANCMSELKDAFFRERQKLNKAEVADVLGKLADAYAKLETSEYAYVNGAYHEAVYEYLKMLQEDVGGSMVKDMTLDQLKELYKAYTMVLTTVKNANKMFADDLKQSKEELANRVMMEVYQAGGEHGLWSKGQIARNQASWNNTKPIYAAERTGSSTFVKLVNGLFKGQYNWATDMKDAKAFRQKVATKYGFKNWDMEKTYKFTSTSGIEFELNLNQIMSLYAYSKRKQAHDHLMKGGFVFGKNTEVVVTKNGIKRTFLNKSAKAHNISDEIMGEIVGKLSKEQRGFVDEMQDYLSTTMGEKGNEVSMRLYGVRLFMEKFYFPLRSAGQFKEKAKEAELKQQQGQISIVNSGFANAVTPKASNPVVLDGFTDVWASHVNEMSLYHSMVLPMEDFRRVYNYASPNMEGQESASVNSFIENAYGDAATGYFDQLYNELNGGAIVDPRETISKQMIGKFKKSAVMLSNSVWVQQFSAISRAYALIDPKYFIGAKVDKKKHAALWAEMKQYAPVVIIKEMGGFDTHTGLSAKDYLLAEEYGKGERVKGFIKDSQYRDEIMGLLPAKADELTWCAIWEAVKRETKAKNSKMDVKSEEFLKKAGERFSEVIEKTQVYDSVLARSANMRSKNGLMQMLTAFMAEPTTTVNMVENALRKGDKKVVARTFGAVAASIILNNALASIIYGMRDDDEDETFIEKYFQAFASGMLDDINPMTYYPILKDIWSLFQGYDIERSDMAIYSDIAGSVKKTVQLISAYNGDMDEEDTAEYYKKVADALMSLLDAGASAFGVPWKNVRRDLVSYYNTFNTLKGDWFGGRDTTWSSFLDGVGGAALDSVPIVGLVTGKSKTEKLYDAIISGDTDYLNRLKGSYKDEDAYNNAVRNALRENDPRIKEAALAEFNGNSVERMRITREIEAEGFFDQSQVRGAINAEFNKLVKDAKGDTPEESNQKEYPDYTVEQYYNAVKSGKSSDADIIYKYLIDEKEKDGYITHEAEDLIATGFSAKVGDDYLNGNISRQTAIQLLEDYTDKGETEVKKWDFELDHGFSWGERVRKYRLGQLSESDLISAVMDIEGATTEEAYAYIDFLDLEMDNPNTDITANDAEGYFKYAEPAGISIDVYLNYKEKTNQCKGIKDANGNTISGSKKRQVLDVINSLPITIAQKDALYYAEGWPASRLYEAPWH